jgi:hypothetical protein
MIKEGDVFRYCWGYGQTNVEFFQVKRLSTSKKTAWLGKIEKYSVDKNGKPKKYTYKDGSGYTMPKLNEFLIFEDYTEQDDDKRYKEEIKKIVKNHDKYGIYFSMGNGIASRWDGKPVRESWYY